MPFSWTIDEGNDVVMITGFGQLTTDDFRKHLRERAADGRVRPDQAVLWDLRGVESFDISSPDMSRHANNVRELDAELGDAPVATVVSDDLGFGLARMFEQRANLTRAHRVFRDFDEALAWLKGGGQ